MTAHWRGSLCLRTGAVVYSGVYDGFKWRGSLTPAYDPYR